MSSAADAPKWVKEILYEIRYSAEAKPGESIITAVRRLRTDRDAHLADLASLWERHGAPRHLGTDEIFDAIDEGVEKQGLFALEPADTRASDEERGRLQRELEAESSEVVTLQKRITELENEKVTHLAQLEDVRTFLVRVEEEREDRNVSIDWIVQNIRQVIER